MQGIERVAERAESGSPVQRKSERGERARQTLCLTLLEEWASFPFPEAFLLIHVYIGDACIHS